MFSFSFLLVPPHQLLPKGYSPMRIRGQKAINVIVISMLNKLPRRSSNWLKNLPAKWRKDSCRDASVGVKLRRGLWLLQAPGNTNQKGTLGALTHTHADAPHFLPACLPL